MTGNPWPRIAWGSAAVVLAVGAILGFLVLGGAQQNGPRLGAWASICRALGISSDAGPAGAPQPPLRTPTRIAWTPATLKQIAAGSAARGKSAALACAGCHGAQGISPTGQFPTLAGMEAAVTYKQLDDFRSGKRASAMMNGIAAALSPEASADIAAYYAALPNGLAPIEGGAFRGSRALREANPAIRLALAGDPARGLAPCGACHGPGAAKQGAPSLHGQKPEYLEHELAAFAQGKRSNDIHQQMRAIARQLTPEEMKALAQFYGA